MQVIVILLLTDKKMFEGLESLTQLCIDSILSLLRLNLRNTTPLMLPILSPFSVIKSPYYFSNRKKNILATDRQPLHRNAFTNDEFS